MFRSKSKKNLQSRDNLQELALTVRGDKYP